MCDVPSIAVFCNESIECFPGTAAKFFLKLLITIPVAPIIIGVYYYYYYYYCCCCCCCDDDDDDNDDNDDGDGDDVRSESGDAT